MIHSSLAASRRCHLVSFAPDLSPLLLLGGHPDRSGGSPATHIASNWLLLLLLLRLCLLLGLDKGGRRRRKMYRRCVLRLCRGRLRRFDQRRHEAGLATVRRRLACQLQERLLDAAEGGRRQRRRRPGRHSAVQSVQRYQLQHKDNGSSIESVSKISFKDVSYSLVYNYNLYI